MEKKVSKNLALLGATGFTGNHVLLYTLERGYRVRALVRSSSLSKIGLQHPNLELVVGDVTERKSIVEVLKNVDAVVSALGPSQDATAFEVHSCAAKFLAEEMPKCGISRYVALSGATMSVPTDKFAFRNKFIKLMALFFTKTNRELDKLLKDKQNEYKILSQSSLDWTIVRAPFIVPNKYEREAKIGANKMGGMKVKVEELAEKLILLIDSKHYSKQAVFIHSVKK